MGSGSKPELHRSGLSAGTIWLDCSPLLSCLLTFSLTHSAVGLIWTLVRLTRLEGNAAGGLRIYSVGFRYDKTGKCYPLGHITQAPIYNKKDKGGERNPRLQEFCVKR